MLTDRKKNPYYLFSFNHIYVHTLCLNQHSLFCELAISIQLVYTVVIMLA